jgi:SAM-dependent methyltransferase
MEGEIREVQIDTLKPSRTVYRHLDSTKVKQLTESIGMFGMRHPITISEDKVIISGNHRIAAMKILGKKTIRAEVLPVSGIMARILMIEENLIRADLTLMEQSEHLAERNRLLLELGERTSDGQHVSPSRKGARSSAGQAPIKSTKDFADEMGIAARTLQERMQIANSIDQAARDKLRDTEISDNKSELIRLAKVGDAADQNAIVDMVISGECKTIKDAVSTFARNKQRKEFAGLASEVKKLPDTIKLTCGDFFDMEDAKNFPKHNSIDAIITDPPYVDSWKENWAPFLGIAADILKPGGFLISYVGHIRLPEFFAGLEETQINADSGSATSKNNKLEFFWACALDHSGSIKAVHARSVQCGFKPICIAFKPPMAKPYKYINDLIQGSGRSKEHHDWEQSIDELIPLLDAYTKPGDVVLDPFAGSCTTAVACKMTARKCICYDLDEENIKIGTKRVMDLDT